IFAPPAHDVCAAFDQIHKHWNISWIVLQICIDRDDYFAQRVIDTGLNRGGLTVVAAESDNPKPRMLRYAGFQLLETAVGAAVVDTYDFEGAKSRESCMERV